MGAYTYSGTAASNTTVDGIGAAGSDSPDNIDNLVRALAASDANLVRDLGGANTVGGSADAITVALADASTPSYFDGMIFSFRAASDNTTTTPTLNVDSLGAKTIKKAVAGVESALVAGDIQAGATHTVVYRSAWATASGAFELLNPQIVSAVRFTNSGVVLYETGAVTPTFQANDLGAAGLGLSRWQASTGGPTLFLGKSRGAAVNTRGVVSSGDVLGSVRFQGDDGTNFVPSAQISASVDGTPGTNDMPGRLEFYTAADGSTTMTERLVIKSDGSWNIATVAGSNGQVVKQVSGATAWGGISTFATVQASTSGSAIDFTGIPSWVREIDIIFNGVSLNGTDNFLVQIGDSGGIETSGYTSLGIFLAAPSSIGGANGSTGFYINHGVAAAAASGIVSLKNITGNVWIQEHNIRSSDTAMSCGGGTKTLSDTLTQVRVTRDGSNSFDAGQINICYR